jgi:hypothetical protein
VALQIERGEGYWRWVGGPVPPGSAAITLGPLIIVRERAAGDPHLLRHELVHVEQWRRLGVVRFLAQYVGSYLLWRLRGHGHRAAYRRIPQEVEAEWRARREAPS